MVSRPVFLAGVGVVVILLALVLNFWILPGDDAEVAVAPPTPENPAPQQARPDAGAPADTATPAARKPSFDVVRVDPEGNIVIAGRASANAEIMILDGEQELGRVQSDDRGEWVFVPSAKLPPGERVLTLRQMQTDGDGRSVVADEAIVLVVPEPGTDIAGRETSESGAPLALVVPRDEAASRTVEPRVLQAPVAGPETGEDTESIVKAYPEQRRALVSITADGSDVSVDIIEYDDQGQVVFGGRTEPNAEVEVFIDDKAVGRTVADSEGFWRLRPSTLVAPGTYNLRVDRVDPSGKVQARIALPFVRAAPLAALPMDRLVVIQPGNNLWRIATRVYGEGTRYIEIHDANRDQIRDPDLIYPGQIFGLPQVN